MRACEDLCLLEWPVKDSEPLELAIDRGDALLLELGDAVEGAGVDWLPECGGLDN